MSTNPTADEVRASIVPNSSQINADELLTGPRTYTVKEVKRGDKEQPIYIVVEEDPAKSFRPCKSMRRILIAAWSDDPTAWVGHKMTLFCDPDVMWAGVKIGGVRISHLSHIDKERTFLLTTTRGKRSEFVIKRLEEDKPEPLTEADEAFIADVKGEIANAESTESLKAIGFILGKKSEAVRNILRPLWAAKHKELEEPTT